ncbi:MAG: nuclear transport factor 2 family protein [Acidimicrobiales bacterium]
MAEHPNVALGRRGYAAFASGDLDGLHDLFADDVVWHQPGNGPTAGDYIGRDRVFEFFGKLFEFSGGTFKAEPTLLLADDDRGAAVQHCTATRDGKTLDVHKVLVCDICDGKFADVQAYLADEQQEDAFWS